MFLSNQFEFGIKLILINEHFSKIYIRKKLNKTDFINYVFLKGKKILERNNHDNKVSILRLITKSCNSQFAIYLFMEKVNNPNVRKIISLFAKIKFRK